MKIEPASPRDLPAVRQLLQRHQLLLEGVEEHVQTMLVSRDDANIVGTAGLEFYKDGALLRSVAVDPAVQGQRVGRQLVEAALRLAQRRDANAVYLLTTTAQRFFSKFGFERISRADVPESVLASVEFQSACCDSAAVMRKSLSRTD